jgi:hypothetical protein
MSNTIIKKEWLRDFKNKEPYGHWEFYYSNNKSIIEIVRSITKGLNQYIRPISIVSNVRMSDDRKNPDYIKFVIANTSKFFTEQDIINYYNGILTSVDDHDETRIRVCFVSFVAFLTYFKQDELISDWFPSMDYYNDDFIENIDNDSLDGIIKIGIDSRSLGLEVYSDIWIPISRYDKLAEINGERLKSILKYIDKTIQSSQIKYSLKENVMDTYGYKKPEDLFPD